MSERCARPDVGARGIRAVNSPAGETLRQRLQTGIPYGTEKHIAARLGHAPSWIYDQVEGKHPLTGDVILGCLLAMPEAARDVAILEWLDGMVSIDRRVDIVSHMQRIEELARETRALLDPEGRK